jgi:hypothetical protein
MSNTFEASPAFEHFVESISEKMTVPEFKNCVKKWKEGSEKSKTFILNSFSAKPSEKHVKEIKEYLNDTYLELSSVRSFDEYSANKNESGTIYLVHKKKKDFFVLNYVPQSGTKYDVVGFNMKHYANIDDYLGQVLQNIQRSKIAPNPINHVSKRNEKMEQQLLMLVEVLNIRYEKFLFESQTTEQTKDTQKEKAKI